MTKKLNIYGTITEQKVNSSDVTAVEVKGFLDSISPDEAVDVFINSYGGHVSAGLAIYNMLKAHKGTVTVTVEGFACSIASIIAFAGETLKMCEGSFLMVHLPYTYVIGDKFEMQKVIDTLNTLEQSMLTIYNANLIDSVHEQTIKQKVYDETWFSASEAAKYFNLEVCNSATVDTPTENKVSNTLLKRLATNESERFKHSVLQKLKQSDSVSKASGQAGVKRVLDRFANQQYVQVEKKATSILEKFKGAK